MQRRLKNYLKHIIFGTKHSIFSISRNRNAYEIHITSEGTMLYAQCNNIVLTESKEKAIMEPRKEVLLWQIQI